MKKLVCFLILSFVFSACQQITITATPIPDQFVPYYGQPQPAKIIVNGATFDSKVGSTTWVYIDSDGKPVGEHGDAPAVITPAIPAIVSSPFKPALVLPIPINPSSIWYGMVDVNDKSSYTSWRVGFWHELKLQEIVSLPLLYEQEIDFSSLESGDYVLVVHAAWEGSPITILEATYGFFIQIQE